MDELPLQVIDDVACTVCGCVCDDLRLHVQGQRVVTAERACALAEPWYAAQNAIQVPAVEIGGQPAEFAEAVVRAGEILAGARAPLVFGLSRSSTEGQRAAVALADYLGANVDTTASLCHAPSIMALQVVGESTCSLGEVKNRSDLVVYWGSDPAVTHPRHMERYTAEAQGMFVPGGRSDRSLVVVDSSPSATSALADLFVPIEPGQHLEAIWTLRALLKGLAPRAGSPLGAPLAALEDLAKRLKSCKSGVVFFGLGLSGSENGHAQVEGLLRLVTELNAFTRFYARRMRIYGDVAGADSVLCWQTGFPFSVNLSRGFPRYGPGEYSANVLLERGEVDACVLVGCEAVELFSPAAQAQLASIPTIVLEHAHVPVTIKPAVKFTTDVYGIHREGTAYRMDEIPIPLRAVLPSVYRSDDEVLGAILANVKELR